MIRTVTYDDSTHKIVPIEPTEEVLQPLYFLIDEDLATIKKAYRDVIAAAPEGEAIEMPEELQRDWKGIDGAIAYHLIDRHADNWGDVGRMMDAWLKANQSAPEYQDQECDELDEYAKRRNAEVD